LRLCVLIRSGGPAHTPVPDRRTSSGEIRMVGNLEARLKEAEKLGFKNCILPKANEKNKNFAALKKALPQLNLHTVAHIRDLAKFFKK
jgi:DNA repair protein RadA/Sms